VHHKSNFYKSWDAVFRAHTKGPRASRAGTLVVESGHLPFGSSPCTSCSK
jgi:hypothetical protein